MSGGCGDRPTGKEDPTHGYADVDYTKRRDDFHSSPGYFLQLDRATDWKPKKQKSVSTDAENYAFRKAAVRFPQVNYLLGGISCLHIRPVMSGDHQSAIHSIKNDRFGETMRKPYVAAKLCLDTEMVCDGLRALEVRYLAPLVEWQSVARNRLAWG